MDLERAASFVRAVLALVRAQATGTCVVRAWSSSALLRLQAGHLVAIELGRSPTSDLLGDHLLDDAALDTERHLASWARKPEGELVGAWLVRSGAASTTHVQTALASQLRARINRVLSSDVSAYRFVAASGRHAGLIDHGVDTTRLLLDAFRERLRAEPWTNDVVAAATLRAWKTDRLTAAGRRTFEALACTADELRVLEGLQDPDAISPAHDEAASRAAVELLETWRRLHLVVAETRQDTPYATLFTKWSQVRRAADAEELLELPVGASRREIGRAFRRLAMQCHPDKFAREGSNAVAELSTVVMAELARAHGELVARSRATDSDRKGAYSNPSSSGVAC